MVSCVFDFMKLIIRLQHFSTALSKPLPAMLAGSAPGELALRTVYSLSCWTPVDELTPGMIPSPRAQAEMFREPSLGVGGHESSEA